MRASSRDAWAEWLLHRRHGDDPEGLQRTIHRLVKVRERVLDNSGIAEGETLLDVGTGDGLIAFGALERVGGHGTVVFSDISPDLLDHAQALAKQMGVADRSSFVLAPAEDLVPIADASVDIVTTRSVLAYVAPKQRALAEFFRVLRPGGRISLYEPINRLTHREPSDRFGGYHVSPVQELAERVGTAYERRQPSDTDPMFDFDERDLVAFVDEAGFGELHLELRVDRTRHQPQRWETFAHSAPNPRAPTLAEAIAETLNPEEADRFVAHLRPLVERGEGLFAVAVAYLWAVKP
ncbi:MAG: class I SAM-dependent methyltransferase [Chloroflexota bacterium]|nr:class I SAM-dependent methyltransferase [Chloroflexota bacterium]